MKKLLLFSLFSLSWAVLSAQEGEGELLSSEYNKKGTVLLVPFNYNYYLSDADFDLAKYNKKNPNEVREALRYGLDGTIGAKLSLHFNTRMVLTDTAVTAAIDLEKLYASVSLKYDKPTGVEEERSNGNAKSWINSKFKKKEEPAEELSADMVEGVVVAKSANRQFMNAEIRDEGLFREIQQKYNAAYIVFVNQFELRTNYQSCLDRATNNFAREISVHYAVFNAEGKQVYGDVITTAYPSNNNNLTDIMEKNFPKIGAEVSQSMPIAASRLAGEN